MGPFDALARRRPERHFPALAEASVLLSLEKASTGPLEARGLFGTVSVAVLALLCLLYLLALVVD